MSFGGKVNHSNRLAVFMHFRKCYFILCIFACSAFSAVLALVMWQLFAFHRWHDSRGALQHVLWWWLPWRECIRTARWAMGACRGRPRKGLQWSAGPQPPGCPRRAVQCVCVPAVDATPPHPAAVPRFLPPLLRSYVLPLTNQVNNIFVNCEVVCA